MTVIEKHEGEVVKFVNDEQGSALPRDPAGSTEHLTPRGKRKRRSIDRRAQRARFDQTVDDRANEIIPTEVTATPGDNLKIKIRKVPGQDD